MILIKPLLKVQVKNKKETNISTSISTNIRNFFKTSLNFDEIQLSLFKTCSDEMMTVLTANNETFINGSV